jgi:hypothetical protein
VAAQALSTYRAGPALSTINRASDRARAVLRAANRARPIWNTIGEARRGADVPRRARDGCSAGPSARPAGSAAIRVRVQAVMTHDCPAPAPLGVTSRRAPLIDGVLPACPLMIGRGYSAAWRVLNRMAELAAASQRPRLPQLVTSPSTASSSCARTICCFRCIGRFAGSLGDSAPSSVIQ